MITQRILHRDSVKISDSLGSEIRHTPELITKLFNEELAKILAELPNDVSENEREKYRKARLISEEMITKNQHDPV